MIFSVAQLYVRYNDDKDHTPVVRLSVVHVVASSKEDAAKNIVGRPPGMEVRDTQVLPLPVCGLLAALAKFYRDILVKKLGF